MTRQLYIIANDTVAHQIGFACALTGLTVAQLFPELIPALHDKQRIEVLIDQFGAIGKLEIAPLPYFDDAPPKVLKSIGKPTPAKLQHHFVHRKLLPCNRK
ncbi:hypothetical protein A6C57_01275 [Fibrella sp. ES10-3-2-2]|nr:hypothetical protein A6C57_01275 [Fibrella sp. ES10-3-2-2]